MRPFHDCGMTVRHGQPGEQWSSFLPRMAIQDGTGLGPTNQSMPSTRFHHLQKFRQGWVPKLRPWMQTTEAVVLRMAEGKEQTIGRGEIDEIRASNISLMPEGVEKDISLQDMANLLEFLKARTQWTATEREFKLSQFDSLDSKIQ